MKLKSGIARYLNNQEKDILFKILQRFVLSYFLSFTSAQPLDTKYLSVQYLTSFCLLGSPGRQISAIPLQTTAQSSMKAHSG